MAKSSSQKFMEKMTPKSQPLNHHRIPPVANHYYNITDSEKLALTGALQQTQQVLKTKLNINHIFPSGATFLLGAIFNQNYGVIELLLNNNADPNLISTDQNSIKHAPFIKLMDKWSGSANYLKAIELFIDRGAQRNIQAGNDTPISKAIKNDNYHALYILLEYKVPLASKLDLKILVCSQPEKDSKTLLDLVVSNSNSPILQLLSDNNIVDVSNNSQAIKMLDEFNVLKNFEIELLRVIEEDPTIAGHFVDIKNDPNAPASLIEFFTQNPLYQEVGKYLFYRLLSENEAFFASGQKSKDNVADYVELRACNRNIEGFWSKVLAVKGMIFPEYSKTEIDSFIADITKSAPDVATIGDHVNQ